MKVTFKGLWKVLKNCFKGFSDDKVLKLSAALAYYTVFSIGPLIMVIIFVCSIFFQREAIEGTLFDQIQSFVGAQGATQIQEIIKNAAVSGKSHVAAIIGIITLIIGATSMFAEMQDSINMIWGLKPKPKAAWFILLRNRLLSFGVIGSLGFLLLVSLAVSGLIEALSKSLQQYFHEITVIVFYIINLVITFGVITLLFAVIFKVLPDAKIKWKDVMSGSIATAILFMLGKFAISFYINKSNVASTYGAAGSFVVILVWIYYSAVILYFGAEFTKAYAIKYGSEIRPNEYSVTSKMVEVEQGDKSIQEANGETNGEENRE